jgi:hypothetical protein
MIGTSRETVGRLFGDLKMPANRAVEGFHAVDPQQGRFGGVGQ